MRILDFLLSEQINTIVFSFSFLKGFSIYDISELLSNIGSSYHAEAK